MDLNETIHHIFKVRSKYEHLFFKGFFTSMRNEDCLSQTHMIAIIVLNINGAMNMTSLSESLNIEKGSFTPVAKYLLENGYINKHKDENDRRVSFLSLTEKGQAFANRMKDEHYNYINDIIQRFDIEDQKRFIYIMDELNNILDKSVDLGCK